MKLPLPDHILEKIEVAQRKPLGKAGRTIAEISSTEAGKIEKQLHADYIGWLNRNGFAKRYFHADTRKRSTLWVGHPDFTVWRGTKLLFIEFKVPPNDLSPEQKERIRELVLERSVVLICFSYEQAASATQRFFGL